MNPHWSRLINLQMNLRQLDARTVTVALDETTRLADIDDIFKVGIAGGQLCDVL